MFKGMKPKKLKGGFFTEPMISVKDWIFRLWPTPSTSETEFNKLLDTYNWNMINSLAPVSHLRIYNLPGM